MATSFQVGDRAAHMNRKTVGGALEVDTQLFASSESKAAFAARVSEMAGLCAAARDCRDATAMTAIQTRIDAIDD